jgi:hypothetical protein
MHEYNKNMDLQNMYIQILVILTHPNTFKSRDKEILQ